MTQESSGQCHQILRLGGGGRFGVFLHSKTKCNSYDTASYKRELSCGRVQDLAAQVVATLQQDRLLSSARILPTSQQSAGSAADSTTDKLSIEALLRKCVFEVLGTDLPADQPFMEVRCTQARIPSAKSAP